MSYVFVLDINKHLLNPIQPAHARWLLSHKRAAVFKQYPFTIILKKEVPKPKLKPLKFKIDPGSKTTGLALVNLQGLVTWVADLAHRGQQIKNNLLSRRQLRRGRRARHTRYRQPRFLNRLRPTSWLPPSLNSRVENILTWLKRIQKVAPVAVIAQELVRFDMQLMQNPEISGVEYQQGTLAGYEVREYLLEKWGRACVYCQKKGVTLQIEHIQPRAKGGSNRVSNLCLACEACNLKKGTKDIKDFFKKKPDLLKKILAQTQKPLKDAAAVNATRWKLFRQLKATGLPVETGSGGLTKYNRSVRNLPKTHHFDAACVGKSTPDILSIPTSIKPLIISAKGHGTRQLCRTDKYGFPSRYVPQQKFVKGYQTGDIVKATVTSGKKIGTHVGRVAVRSTGSFNIQTASGLVQGISHKYCKPIHKKDGYSYGFLTGE